MSPTLLDEEQLIRAGWTKRQIDAALDEPDDVGPSGHWLNTHGKPYYDRDRVAVAAFRTGLTKKRPPAAQWSKWVQDRLPTSRPVWTADFHGLAAAVVPGVEQRFWSLRISHPVMGRLPGARAEEGRLIEDCLKRLIVFAFDVELSDSSGLDQFLVEKSTHAANSLSIGWPGEVVVRPARRASYVSKARSKKAIQKFMAALSMVHTGRITGPSGERLQVPELLVRSPRLRFDTRAPF